MSAARLGKGVEALFRSGDAPFEQRARLVALAQLHPNPDQPRRRFAPEEIAELAASVKSYGIIQPLIVEERGLNDYLIIAGERRYRAAQQLGLAEVPVICRAGGETERLAVALIENVQRSDLAPLEEARAYRVLLEQTGITQEELAARVGKSRSTIANSMRLLALPAGVQRLLERGRLTAGHARAVLMVEGAAARERLAADLVRLRLSVRDSEELARRRAAGGAVGGAGASGATVATGASAAGTAGGAAGAGAANELAVVARRIEEHLLTRVAVQGDEHNGRISIYYHSLTDLNRIYRRICRLGD